MMTTASVAAERSRRAEARRLDARVLNAVRRGWDDPLSDDEFDDLASRVPPSAQVNYPQLLALALVLRHSWFPEDLAQIIAEPGLSPTAIPPTTDRSRFSEVIDTAKPRGFGNHSAASPQTRTPQKGEQQTC